MDHKVTGVKVYCFKVTWSKGSKLYCGLGVTGSNGAKINCLRVTWSQDQGVLLGSQGQKCTFSAAAQQGHIASPVHRMEGFNQSATTSRVSQVMPQAATL